ncbi:hypothetical protein ACFE04_002179 [Oxalis oulophora]
MEKKLQNIVQYRERLNKTLMAPELTNEETLKILVKNQIAISAQNEYEGCNDNIIEKRTSELSNTLDMLRSAAVNDHDLSKATAASVRGEWKLKEDNEESRVMYREGPEGTPFHTLLAEGYVDGPLDICLCIAWEPELYKKWWPQSIIPPFKIVASKYLQRIRIGEHIALIRVKLMWPLSTREVVVHFYLFEYLQGDLVIGLMNTIPELQSIDKSTHGYTIEGIPEAKDVVRMDLFGGFAMQKLTPTRSYFRTLANLDVKLDFVPPSLINFISRQLIGSGIRLYHKWVKSVSNNAEDYSAALQDRMYTHISEVLYSNNKPEGLSQGEEHEIKAMPENAEFPVKSDVCEIKEDPIVETGNSNKDEKRELEIHSDDQVSPKNEQTVTKNKLSEIEEQENGEECEQIINSRKPLVNLKHHNVESRNNIIIRPEVEQALGILDKAISLLRDYGLNEKTKSTNELNNGEQATFIDQKGVCSNVKVYKKDTEERTSQASINSSTGARESRNTRSSSYSREANHNKIAPASSPEEYFSIPIDNNQIYICSSKNWTGEVAVSDGNNRQIYADSNNNIRNRGNRTNDPHKKFRRCCF